MEILDAFYDLTGPLWDAAELAGCSHPHGEAACRGCLREVGGSGGWHASELIDPFLPKVEARGLPARKAIRAGLHDKLLAGVHGSERTTRRWWPAVKAAYRLGRAATGPWVTEPGMWLQQ